MSRYLFTCMLFDQENKAFRKSVSAGAGRAYVNICVLRDVRAGCVDSGLKPERVLVKGVKADFPER